MGKPTIGVAVSLVAVLTLGIGNLAMASGIRSANDYFLSTGPTFEVRGDRIHKNVSETFTIVNGNSRTVLVRQIGQNGPGLQLLIPHKLIPLSGAGPTHKVPPHGSIQLIIWYHVSDCAGVPKGSRSLTMEVAWTSGKWQRVSLQMPSGPVPWPRSMTDLVCR
jgi:hypothetical protein